MHSQQLEYFCKIAECGSFSRTATLLGINQSALSRHVGKLEEELGVSLFYRHGRGVVLTDDGRRLFERSTRALEEIRLALHEASASSARGIDAAVIGMTPTVGRILTASLARRLIAKFPQIKLRFIEGFSAHLLDWLDAGRLDVAILYESWVTHRLNAERVTTERLCLVASSRESKLGSTVETVMLGRVPLILPSAPHGLRRLVDLVCAENKLSPSVQIEADSFDAILNLVKANLGYTVLPLASIQGEIARGDLQASLLVSPEVTRSLVLATPTNRPPLNGLFQMTSVIKAELAKFESH